MPPAARVALSYTPHKPDTGSLQQAFHEGRYRYRYRAALAGTGGGKTHAAAWEVLTWMLENPPGVALCCEPDFRRIHMTMVPAFEAHLGTRLAESPLTAGYNEQKGSWTLRNGWVVWFVPLDKPGKEEGPNVDLIWADEVRLVRHWGGQDGIWEGLRRRLRGSRPGNRMGCIVTTHSPTEEQDAWFRGRDDARIYRWSTQAALRAGTLPVEYQEYARGVTGKAAERILEGRFALAEGLVYDNFEPEVHVKPWPQLPDGRRVTPEFMSYGVDWGWTQPACLSAVAWLGETSHVVEEFYGTHYGVEDLIAQAHALEERWGRGKWWCGHDRPDHIRKFQEAGLAAEAFVGKVADGCDLLNDKLAGLTHFVDPLCVETIREKKSYGRKPGTDEPEKGDDHSQDAERYGTLGPGRGTRVGVFRQSSRGSSGGVGVFKQSSRAWRHPRLP